MTDRKIKITLYLLYSVLAVVFFLYVLFPAESVKGYIEYRTRRAAPEAGVTIGSVAPSFPPGLKLMDTTVSYKENLVAKLDAVTLKPSLFSLISDTKKVNATAVLGKGRIKTNATFSEGMPPRKIKKKIKISKLPIGELPAIENLTGYTVTGSLNGSVNFSKEDGKLSFDTELKLSEGAVTLPAAVFSVKEIAFKTIEATVNGTDKKIHLTRAVITGDAVSGSISGEINLRKPFQQSRLNLEGVIKPGKAAASEELSSALALLNQAAGTGGFAFTLKGSINDPLFNLK